MKLSLDYTRACGISKNFSCLIASKLAAAEREHAFSWSRRTALNSKHLRLFRTAVFCYGFYEGWNFNSGNYLFTTDTK